MTATLELIKTLRATTGAPMLDCKKALEAAGGDLDKAVEEMRKAGQAKAGRKADRTASEGLAAVMISDDKKRAMIVEVNCETDFVSRDDNFRQFVDQVAQTAMQAQLDDVAALLAHEVIGGTGTVEEARTALVAKIGENIQVRRVSLMQANGTVVAYVHNGRIAVLVDFDGADKDLGRSIAMHIAASNPQVIKPKEVPQALIDKEREIFEAQAANSGKPAEIVTKMVEGRIQKFVKEVSLLEQPFVRDPSSTVGDVLKQVSAEVNQFIRFEVGEGIEKEKVDFAREVMAQVKGDN